MIQKLCKLHRKEGFTLMEMLIVVAIIAILAAIAIPVFTAQLSNTRKGVDDANMRAAKSAATSIAMSAPISTSTTYMFAYDSDGNLTNTAATPAASAGYNQNAIAAASPQAAVAAKSGYIAVTVDADFSITSALWVTGTGA